MPFIQGTSSETLVDSGGAREEDGKCIDEMELEFYCTQLNIDIQQDQIMFQGSIGFPITQAYIYNLTAGVYEYYCSRDCGEEFGVDISLSESEQYLLGINYYDETGALLCFITLNYN